MMQQDILLESLGYNIDINPCIFFKSVVEEVVESMGSFSDEEVKALIEDKNSHIYVEPACFYFEVGLNNFHKCLEYFHESKTNPEYQEHNLIFGNNESPTLQDAIFGVAKYYSDKEKKETEKISVKRLTMVLPACNISTSVSR